MFLEAVHQHKGLLFSADIDFEGSKHCNFYIKTFCMIFCFYCLSFVSSVKPMALWLCLQMSTLCFSASLLEHYKCFPREDVFLILPLGSVSENTVPRAVFPCTLPREQGVYWIMWSLKIISLNMPSLLPGNIKKYTHTVRWILTVLKSILPW